MITINKLIQNKHSQPAVRYTQDDGKGANIIFIPEILTDKDISTSLESFLSNQILSNFHQLTIPIISNFIGRKLMNNKYYVSAKKKFPQLITNKTIAKQNELKSNVFDLTGLISDIMSLSKSRSQKIVFEELVKVLDSVVIDYKNDTYLVIDGSTAKMDASYFLSLLLYYARIHNNKIDSKLKGIIYTLKGKSYPIGIPIIEDDEPTGALKIQMNLISELKMIKNKETELKKESLDDIKEKVKAIANDSTSSVESQKKIRKLVTSSGLPGTFQQQVKSLFDEKTRDDISAISLAANKKYNGNVNLNIKPRGVFDMQKIVGLDEVSNYNKQKSEVDENIDELIEDLVHGTIGSDPDVDIKILSIKNKIVDDKKNRYKEYQVRIQHKNFGNTTNKPYTVSFRVPVTVNGKYIKLGGNNYVLINQLFPKVLQKVSPNMVRLYTHYSVASLSLKATNLKDHITYVEIEDKFIQQLKQLNKVETTLLDNETKDLISEKYKIDDLLSFKYKKIIIKD